MMMFQAEELVLVESRVSFIFSRKKNVLDYGNIFRYTELTNFRNRETEGFEIYFSVFSSSVYSNGQMYTNIY